jgi:hypothetical protein
VKSAGNTPFLKILIIVFEYQQVLSTGFTTLGIKTDFEEYRKKVGYKEYELESNKQIGSVIRNYNNALKRRTTNDEMRFSLPNYFYFVGLASIIIQMPCSGEICEKIAESERFLVHAFRIAPHMVERDVLLASLYMYLKRKEVH